MVADHLSRLIDIREDKFPLDDSFPNDKLFALIQKETPWYDDFVNYLFFEVLPLDKDYQREKKFFSDLRHYYWDESLLFKRCADEIFWRCIPEEEFESVVIHWHSSAYGRHETTDKNVAKILEVGLYWPNLLKGVHSFIKRCDQLQRIKNISKRNEILPNNTLEVDIFDV